MPKKSHKKLIITLVILAVLAGGITFGVMKVKKNAEEVLKQLSAYEVSTIEKRSIVDSVAATGKITSLESKTISPAVTGVKIMKVNVKVGDIVEEGDIIAELDSSDLETTLENLITTQDVAQKQSDSSLSSAYKSLRDAKNERAIQIERAQKTIDDLEKDWEDRCKKAVDAWNTYNTEYQKAVAAGATVNLYDTRELYPVTVNGKATTLGALYSEFYQANEVGVNAYKATYEKTLEQAKQTMDDIVRRYDSSVATAQTAYNSTKLTTSTTGLNNDAQLKTYEDQIEACVVKAPFSGIVTMVNANVGERFLGTPIVTIENISDYLVTAEIDEYDIGKIKVGQRVAIKTNGTGDEILDGTVKEIAPRASLGVGTGVTYTVKVAVNTKNDLLRLDMTSKISIVIDEVSDILTVPYEAIQTTDDGRTYVEIAKDYQPGEEKERLYVTKGLESSYYVEVSGVGVNEGVKIIVPSSKGTSLLENLLNNRDAMGGF